LQRSSRAIRRFPARRRRRCTPRVVDNQTGIDIPRVCRGGTRTGLKIAGRWRDLRLKVPPAPAGLPRHRSEISYRRQTAILQVAAKRPCATGEQHFHRSGSPATASAIPKSSECWKSRSNTPSRISQSDRRSKARNRKPENHSGGHGESPGQSANPVALSSEERAKIASGRAWRLQESTSGSDYRLMRRKIDEFERGYAASG